MDDTQKPRLSLAWWNAVRPARVRGRQLDNALADFEKAAAGRADADGVRALARATTSLVAAVGKTVRECHAVEDRAVVAGLEQLAQLAKARLEAGRRSAEEDDEDDGTAAADDSSADVLDPARLRRLMASLGAEPLAFACAFDAAATHFALDRRRRGVALANAVVQASGCTKATHGTATLAGREMVLDVQGPRLAGLVKRLNEHLATLQPLPCTKARLARPAP
jgi:hypothetical protein